MLRCRARFHCAKTPLQREHEEIGGSIRRRARDQSADLLLSLKPCQHQRNCQATFLVVTQDRIQCFPSVENIKIIQNNFQSTSRKNWKFALVHPLKKTSASRVKFRTGWNTAAMSLQFFSLLADHNFRIFASRTLFNHTFRVIEVNDDMIFSRSLEGKTFHQPTICATDMY